MDAHLNTPTQPKGEPITLPTDEQIELFAAKLCRERRLSWAGFRDDGTVPDRENYTIPVVSQSVGDLVRAAIKEDRERLAVAAPVAIPGEPEGWTRLAIFQAAKACAAHAFDHLITNSPSQKFWQSHADNLNAIVDAIDSAAPAPVAVASEPAGWRSALKFYADRSHFMLSNEDAWDTVSGEPSNFWCDEEGTATVEDGTVAARALAGDPLPDDEDATPPTAAPLGVPVEARDWELTCDECAGTGKVDVSEALHVDGRYMGDQLLRETCNTCMGYGFTVCLADIPKEIQQ